MTKTTITINGRVYDAITGMPLQVAKNKTMASTLTAQRPVHAQAAKPKTTVTDVMTAPVKPSEHRSNRTVIAHQAIHQAPQKSQTLYRKALKKPVVTTAVRPQSARSPMISRFGASVPTKPQKASSAPQRPVGEQPQQLRPAMQHPAVIKALQNQAAIQQKMQQPQPTGTQLKEQLIKERLNEVGTPPQKTTKKMSWLSRQPRMATILTTSLAILVLGGYLTYITLPTISLKVAASRAGVSASLPEYKPDGYSLNGPIAYSPGEVIIAYKSNTNNTGFKLTQKATNWDSRAVLDNYVERQSDNYLTFQERGLTIYTFGNKAAWVNGGLLYTLDGDAALSTDQILRVATSM